MSGPARGFTLVETMVVLGIVAILALMIPTYHQRSVREQVVEALPLAEIAKAPVAARWAVGCAASPRHPTR